MKPRLHYDDVAWEKSEAIADGWFDQILEHEILIPVGNFLVKHHSPSEPDEFTILGKGAYNICFKMTYKDANAAAIRFAQPGVAMFPEEKTRNEVATMRYIYDQTSIPVPLVYHWGTRKECPLELSLFIIMEHIDYDRSMYRALNWPVCPGELRGSLNPDISEEQLEGLYSEAAGVLLQLFQKSLPKIGSLEQIDNFTWEVTQRPLSMSINTLVELGTLPRSELPQTTFGTASSYFKALAELHLSHLTHQRNDVIDSEDDCRRKLVARYLFRKLAREHRLTQKVHDRGPFKLWCDHFRPANNLLNQDLKIAGVVDWEFTYAAPVEFSLAPPWWLLIERPEFWDGGLFKWCDEYERRLPTLLRAMKSKEDKGIEQGFLKMDQRLSEAMKKSWESGDFWISYAARINFTFDLIYWLKLTSGSLESLKHLIWSSGRSEWKERVELLEPEERDETESIVKIKLEEMETRTLLWDPDEFTKEVIEKAERQAAQEDESRAEAGVNDEDDVGEESLAALSLDQTQCLALKTCRETSLCICVSH